MDLKGDFHWRSRRRNIFAITALAIVATSALYLVHIPGDHEGLSCPLSIPDVKLPLVNGSVPERRILSDTAGGLRFRDSLTNGTKYLTTFMDAGWTNNFMTIVNMVYLSTLTDRVPILPAFMPMHVGADAPAIPFGEVFDIPRLASIMRRPLLEWHEIKDPLSTELEPLGCWSLWETVSNSEPRPSLAPNVYSLDVSYTRVPDWIPIGRNEHTTFWRLAKLSYPEGKEGQNSAPRPSPQTHASLEPDQQLMCFDFMYYVSAEDVFEWERSFSPAWRDVATHLHWTPRLESIANVYLRTILGVQAGASIPPYIAIHVRHGDFGGWCDELDPDTQCFAPLRVWSAHVDALRAELREQKGVTGEIPVIVTSDERKQAWWDEVASLGWHRIDHERMLTNVHLGKWYAVFIDAVIQAGATGFLGTQDSTMSLLALRRVQDWQGGIGHMVGWNSHNNHPELLEVGGH